MSDFLISVEEYNYMQNYIVIIWCRIELYSMHFPGVVNTCTWSWLLWIHTCTIDIVIAITIVEIKVCDNRIKYWRKHRALRLKWLEVKFVHCCLNYPWTVDGR